MRISEPVPSPWASWLICDLCDLVAVIRDPDTSPVVAQHVAHGALVSFKSESSDCNAKIV